MRIEDDDQGWELRLGNIQQEFLVHAAEQQDRLLFESLKRDGPIWGVWWGVAF